MPDYIVPVGDSTAPRYRYYTADLISNTIIGELSLEDVSYERSLKSPGSFDGKITITDQTNSLDLYNATMPGKTAIYAVRDGVCVWGGIIWGRTYDMVGRSLTFSASEFTSYLNHRIVWKAYSQSFEATLTKQKKKSNDYFLIQAKNKMLLNAPAVGDKVRVSFLQPKLRKFTKDYLVAGLSSDPAAPADPGQTSFFVKIPKLPYPLSGSYSGVTVTMKVDTYEYLKDLITNTLNDFEYIQFPNEEITPGIKIPITVSTKKLVTSDSTHGIATLTTATAHNLVLGQRVEIANVDYMLDGVHAVAEIPNPTSFTYVLDNPLDKYDKLNPIILSNISEVAVTETKNTVQYRQIIQYLSENITHLKRVSGEVTLQLNSQHRFSIGDGIVVNIEGKKPTIFKEGKKDVNSFDYIKYNNKVVITDITSDTITFMDPVPGHANGKYDIPNFSSVVNPANNTVKLAAPKTLLKVFPTTGVHGYNIGEQVQIVNVDGFTSEWQDPIFDGYSEIYEVSPGTLYTINNYKIELDAGGDDALKDNDTYVYLYVGADPSIKARDQLLIDGLTTDATSVDVSFLNGIHVVEENSAKYDGALIPTQTPTGTTSIRMTTTGDHGIVTGQTFTISGVTPAKYNGVWVAQAGTTGNILYANIGSNPGEITSSGKLLQYYVYFRFNWDTVGYKGAGAGGTASVNGKSWVAYQPAYSEIKDNVTLKEPDAISSFSSISYTPDAGATSNKLTVITTSRHNLVVGDKVSVAFGKGNEEEQKIYGASLVDVTSVADLNTFTYTVPKNSKSTDKVPIPPKKSTNGFISKTGTVTRIKSTVGAPQPVQTSFTNVYATSGAEGGIAKVYSVDHGLSAGDSVIIDVDGSTEYLLENNKEPVKITDTTQDTFSYSTNTDIPATDDMDIRGIGFTTDAGKKVITFDIVEKTGKTVAAATSTITKIKPKWHKGAANENYVTYTTTSPSPRAIVAGDKVTITGLENSGTSSISTTSATVNLISFSYIGAVLTDDDGYSKEFGSNTLILVFASPHGLPIDSGYDDDDAPNNKNYITFSGYASNYSIRLDSGKLAKINLSGFNGGGVIVKSVINANTLSIAVNGGKVGYYSLDTISGATSTAYNTNKVSNTYYNFEQFNCSGTVDYVSGSTFSVKYDFLSNKSGNGVNSSGAIGTEYTLSTTGSAKFAAKQISGIAANSVISVYGLVDGTVNKYSKLNGVYKVKKTASNSTYSKNPDGTTASPALVSTKVYVLNTLKTDDGKSTLTMTNYPASFDAAYTDAKYPLLKNGELQQWQTLSGTAYVELSKTARDTYAITKVSRSSTSNTVAVITAADHGLAVGDYVEVNVLGKYASAFNQGGLPRLVTAVTDTTFRYTMSSPEKTTYYSVSSNVVTLYFATPHNFVGKDLITVSGVATGINGSSREITSTGPRTISFRITTADKTKTAKIGTVTMGTAYNFTPEENVYRGYAVPGAFIKRTPTVFSRTFGEFPANAGIGGTLAYSTQDYSGNSILNTPIAGSSLNTVASILDKYSSGLNGFEYRVDCKLVYDSNGNKNFTKTFVLVPTYPTEMTTYLASLPDKKLAVGQWAPPAAFGADKVIFEYPGNITNVNMTESAQDSATRVFVSSSSSDSGGGEVKYSAASDTTLLAAGWPLLDKKETVSYPQPNTSTNKNLDVYGNYDIETDFHTSATRFLYESKPPQGDITISVNGSLTPVVGSYDPGSWCSIIIKDNFVKNRLNSPLEPRKDVIVRKIDAIKVQVPNNPAFPEMIDLTLVPDWQVDAIGK